MKRKDFPDALRQLASEAAGHQHLSSIVKSHPVALDRKIMEAIYADRDADELDAIRKQLAKAGLM